MDSPNVEIISDCFIEPDLQSTKPIYLSSWDLSLVSLNYIQKGLLYPLPENDKDFSVTTFLNDLKHSLSATLAHFPPLAARLATVKQQNPPSVTVFLNPENSPGARFIHSSVDLTVADIVKPTDVPLVVQSFFDHHQAINYDGHELSLLTVKVTQLIDGIFIGCSINHVVADGASYWYFFNTWSKIHNFKGQNGLFISPILNRLIPPGSGPIVTLPFTHENEFINRPHHPILRERIFHFTSDSLAKLKEKVNFECNTTTISTFQSLSALVWRGVTRARHLRADEQTSCSMAVNNRKRLSTQIPENYFGNMIQALEVTTTAGELVDHGVGWAALRLNEVVVNHGDKEVRDAMEYWVKSPFVVNVNAHFVGNNVHMGSSPRFDMYGNEFGLGKPLAVLSGWANKFDGKVTLYPGREGGGSVDLEVCLLPENMVAFECDDEFMSVVNERFVN